MSAPEAALAALADQLRAEQSVISPQVADPGQAEPVLGVLVAAGPRTAQAPGEYSLVIESVREGYLLHYEEPRVVVGADANLALLAGDYLYALGLERLAGLGDLDAIRELSDLISLSAQLHDAPADEAAVAGPANALWLASVTAVASGATPEHEQGKAAFREGRGGGALALWQTALATAQRAGLADRLERTAESIGFEPEDLPA